MGANVGVVYELLQRALSQDGHIRKEAEAALAAAETTPGFCSCLMEILGAKGPQQDIRWMSCVYLKLCTKKYWRTRHPNAISEEEKAHLRTRILNQLGDEDDQVASQLAVLIAKIARVDFPKAWPDLFGSLIQKLQGADLLLTERICLTLDEVLKELASKRLAADQKVFAEVTSQLFDYSWHYWCGDTQTIIDALSSIKNMAGRQILSPADMKTLLLTCNRWYFCLKSIRRMLRFGFPSDAKAVEEVPTVQKVVPSLLQAVQTFIPLEASLRQQALDNELKKFNEKSALKLLKTINDVQATHPFSFSSKSLLFPVLDYCYRQIADVPSNGAVLDPALVQCMTIVQNVLKCVAYRESQKGRILGEREESQADLKGRLAAQAREVVHAFMSQEKLVYLCRLLIQRFFILSPNDLEKLAESPEDYYHEESIAGPTDGVRPCAEGLFLALFEDHREILAPVVLAVLKEASEACPPGPASTSGNEASPALLFKEAAYNAVGLANYDLEESVDFKSWYDSSLSVELLDRNVTGRLLRSRVAWLLGRWVAKVKGELRRPVYQALVELLQEDDAAVQLSAIGALRALIDDVHFFEHEFEEFLGAFLQFLFQFLYKATNFESQSQGFNLVSLIIERIGDKIVPFAEKLLAIFPNVWTSFEGQSLIRIQVLLALQRLVHALGPRSTVCHPVVLPILRYSTDVTQPDEVNMLEDGMLLWQTVLRHTPAVTLDLVNLFPHLEAVMEKSFDHLPAAMSILESYILLGGAQFLQLHAQRVAHIFELVVGNIKEKGYAAALPAVDLLIQCFPMESPAVIEPTLQKLLAIVLGTMKESELVKAAAAAVLARVLLQNTAFFLDFLPRAATAIPALTQSAKAPLFVYVDCLLEKFDSMTTAPRRKLCALALCAVLPLKENAVLERLEQIVSASTGVFHETDGDTEAVPYESDYGAVCGTANGSLGASQEGEHVRRRQVYETDPTNILNVGLVVLKQLAACKSVHGESTFNSAMARMHPQILAQLNQLMAM
ncbi:Nuclear transport receptor KAP120 (importin beta superfamily) [Klebsormidium nitens]|uniref:Nuclear transport receptor KAP120 (Importin beta superfamily) n=1 Tax=Klebsormidium nitens TaxID=105231 RepID=A0A1Y1IP83_KLENI|nr:Nuclear transport receptor KAP120 (importin beta superfamily) [Klebsormidium nitens]|eukprot:GAQ92680.1 Nuclear transport receptor KAP120 (importin beta superfamily) [Klebsormidium nitens]